MKFHQRIVVRAFGIGLCLALIGCSGEPTQPDASATTQVTASATPAETSNNPEAAPSSDSNLSSSRSSDSEDEREINGVILGEADETLKEASEMTVMNIEPGTERYFQNTPNEAEIAYAKKRHKENEAARVAAEETRKAQLNSGNDAPVFNPGGGDEIVTVP